MLNPDAFHGKNKRSNFFEGWYYKFSTRDGSKTFALIPGIFLGKTREEDHAFLQVLLGDQVDYQYLQYPRKQFWADTNDCHIVVANNTFSLDEVLVNTQLPDGRQLHASLTIQAGKKWTSTLINPGSMGYFNYIPFMECYMQTCLMDANINGFLAIDNDVIDLSGGRMYIEKNWGKSFPRAWIWVQANQFNGSIQPVSLSCAIGYVPFMHMAFHGFMIGLTIDDAFYEFSTTNHAKVNVRMKDDAYIVAENKRYRLTIQPKTQKDLFMQCKGPTKTQQMAPLVWETLQAQVRIELVDKASGKVMYEGECTSAGVEYTNAKQFV